MKRLTVEKGLLRETEIVQKQIKALLRCDVGLHLTVTGAKSVTDSSPSASDR